MQRIFTNIFSSFTVFVFINVLFPIKDDLLLNEELTVEVFLKDIILLGVSNENELNVSFFFFNVSFDFSLSLFLSKIDIFKYLSIFSCGFVILIGNSTERTPCFTKIISSIKSPSFTKI